MSKLENPPAFPIPNQYDPSGVGIAEGAPGMSLKDYFAGQALPAIVAATSSGCHQPLRAGESMTIHQAMARDAYVLADAMLAQRTKGENIDVRA